MLQWSVQPFTAHTTPLCCCRAAGALRLAEDEQYLQAPVLSQQDLLKTAERPRATKLIKLDLAKLNEKAPVQYQSGAQLRAAPAAGGCQAWLQRPVGAA